MTTYNTEDFPEYREHSNCALCDGPVDYTEETRDLLRCELHGVIRFEDIDPTTCPDYVGYNW